MSIEKVKMKSCIDTGKKYNDKPIVEIELEDGRKGSAFDNSFMGLDINSEYEFDIKPAKEYQGEKRFYFNIPNKDGQKKKFTKDWNLEKRKLSLEFAIGSIKLTDKQVTTANITALADEYFEYLNK